MIHETRTGNHQAGGRILLTRIALVLAVSVPLVAATGGGGRAAACNNAVVCENQLAGVPQSVWDVKPVANPTIEGFADDDSVNAGETLNFKITTAATAYHVDIYRLGYYGGDGARLVTTLHPTAPLPQTQPACHQQLSTGLLDCGNWAVSVSWNVPNTTVSGVFVADLLRDDGVGGASQITFVVRNDDRASAILFQTDDETEQAYNNWGGNSLYQGSWGPGLQGSAWAVSYNRPSSDRYNADTASVFASEYPMIRWLERNGYDVAYLAGVDTDRYGATLLPRHKIFLSVGHDEYVSAAQRANIEAALAQGVSLGYFSGNENSWKTRWQPSIAGPKTDDRTLVCYKERTPGQDPSGVWTGHWGDPAGGKAAGAPGNALDGQIFYVINPKAKPQSITVPASFGKLRMWRNTAVARLRAGHSLTLGTSTLGYESDIEPDNDFRPPGTFSVSYTAEHNVWLFDPATFQYTLGDTVHQMSMYRAPSGALVFAVGTIQWSWGLDSTHDLAASTEDRTMQQATVNVLADMGAQAQSLQTNLDHATASADTTPPASQISGPGPGTALRVRRQATITGTGADSGGGVVAEVDVSVDGGHTWLPATGTARWSFAWTPTITGSAVIQSRAVDDSDNIEQPTPGVAVRVTR
jgi:hypothetical protein